MIFIALFSALLALSKTAFQKSVSCIMHTFTNQGCFPSQWAGRGRLIWGCIGETVLISYGFFTNDTFEFQA